MVLYKDLGKPANDLLKKGFPHEKPWELEYKYKSKNPQITNTAGVSALGGFDATSTLVYTSGDATAEVKVLSSGKSYVDLSYRVPQIPSLILSSRFDRKAEKATGDAFDFSAEYVTPTFHTILTTNPALRTFSTSGSFGYDRFRFGGEVSGKLDASNVTYALGAAYTAPLHGVKGGWNAAVKTAPCGNLAFGKVIGTVHAVSFEGRGAEVAAEVEYNVRDSKSNITFGGLWALDDEKETTIKSKINHQGILAVSVTHRLCSSLHATLGTQLDVSKPQNSDNVKYGVKLDISS